MKKLFNFVAFIIIIGLVGSWECGNSDFKTLLLNVGTVLSVVMASHYLRIIFVLSKYNKKVSKNNVIIS